MAFIPLYFISVFAFALGLIHFFHLSSPYVPNLILIFSLLGLLESLYPLDDIKISRSEFFKDIFFTILNPILMPVVWYVLFYPLFNLKITLGGLIPAIPIPVQILIIFLLTEFFRYWLHRFQHEIPFLWKFHAELLRL